MNAAAAPPPAQASAPGALWSPSDAAAPIRPPATVQHPGEAILTPKPQQIKSDKRSSKDVGEPSSSGGGAGSPSNEHAENVDSAVELDPISACLLNLDVPLAQVMLFFDIDDIPATAQACKCWNSGLKAVENELWLGLVRKHHPTVERITMLLPDHVGKVETNDVASHDIPPPSKNWKRQYQRSHLAKFCRHHHLIPPLPKPLDSYFFEVQYLFWKNENVGRKFPVRVVVESAAWCGDDSNQNLNIMLTLERSYFAEILDDQNNICSDRFPYFSSCITIFDRSSGQQAILFGSKKLETHRGDKFVGEKQYGVNNLANLVRWAARYEDLRITVNSGLSVDVDDSNEKIQIGIDFRTDIRLDDYDMSIDQETPMLDKAQVLDILQNKLAWK